MTKWAYDMTNEELVNEFMNASARAGASNSGLVIDFAAGSQLREARYLKGVLLARLDGQKPPFKRDEKVKLKDSSGDYHFGRSSNTVGENYSHGLAEKGVLYKIQRVFYAGGGKWELAFEGSEEYRYIAPWFTKIDEVRAEQPQRMDVSP